MDAGTQGLSHARAFQISDNLGMALLRVLFARGTNLSGFIPVRTFAMRTYLWLLVFFARDPLVPAALAPITPNLDFRHVDRSAAGSPLLIIYPKVLTQLYLLGIYL